ncbi:bifunctional methylenetetrahydrofolate dehydrogenase/cyclohydrolase 2, mitochondrial isoform X2 [Lithobates pipiens]
MASTFTGIRLLQRTKNGIANARMTTWSRSYHTDMACSRMAFQSSRSSKEFLSRGLQTSRMFCRSKAQIISGTNLAKEIKKEIQKDVESWLSLGNQRPHLSVILVGDDQASHTYVKNKIKAASTVGISSEVLLRPSNITQDELLDIISKLNRDASVSGLLVQLPLPGIETFGKNVVVAGRSKNVGMPIAMLLHTDGRHERPGGDATVTITHRYTPKALLKRHTQLADIIIVAAGIPKLITADMIKEGAAIIDVGINHIEDPATGKTIIVGDVDLEGVKEKAGVITPVPGGVGPMTVAMLLKNTLMAAQKLIY